MAYAIWKCRGNIFGLNRWLLASWAIESLFSIVLSILYNMNVENKYDQLNYINYLLQDLNYLFFIAAIFRLKKIQTYMDSRNDTREKIKASLLQLKRIAATFLVM